VWYSGIDINIHLTNSKTGAKKMIKLGNKVRDKVTGFTGIATTRLEYLNGCVQFCVKPMVSEDGKMPEGEYIDDAQLEFVEDGVTVDKDFEGGPVADAPPTRYK
jgi:hypothetical protein